jgi:hypothetical protein
LNKPTGRNVLERRERTDEMNASTRRKFLTIAGGALIAGGTAGYLWSDKRNFSRADIKRAKDDNPTLQPNEEEILFLASLAPSGHNTQPWSVQYLDPYHWIIGNDKTRWLPAVDPTQRETMLSIGAFLQNLEYAAGSFGYVCHSDLLAKTNQDERVIEVRLQKHAPKTPFDITKIKNRRTVRSHFLSEPLRNDDLKYFMDSEPESIYYLSAASPQGRFISEQTIQANRLQSYRDAAQQELSEWIRFSSKNAEKYRDGLTTASMEIEGIPGWVVRNFYGKSAVMKRDFRERAVDNAKQEVSESAGWILITSRDESPQELLETGRRMQRLFLKARGRSVAIHPMTQILEESSTKETLTQSLGMPEPVQFILRSGYVKRYPPPVSLRRPVGWFVRT